MEAEFKKKKGGKGLSVLTGRDLYEYKKELFSKADDEDDDILAAADAAEKPAATATEVASVTNKIAEELFLQGDDDDLDDLDDMDE